MSQQVADVLDQRSAVEAVRSAHRFELNLPVLGAVPVPPPEQLAYFAAMGLMVAFEIIEWPIALTIAAGHLLATDQHNRILEEVGEALEGV
ncbi:hypothetical protein [Rhodococcus sp. IEGM 1379]|uniref:hypothetical protein n=1 Tax=Rhodococcus sp. IEGM 1379 TaxID=3047086 RepID=UPI0024B84EA2|nr:hypothetical protein [Rhodococcus sp. IEGM 1379]MDI9915765.1 hypothetical protein [Rhodococcus sp. IEGM 1379]